jgi:hypothetical protein
MEVLVPFVEYATAPFAPAERLRGIQGAVVGVLDGWGMRQTDGTVTMYPVLEAVLKLLEQRAPLDGHLWVKKARAGSPPTDEQMNLLVERSDVVLVGVCLSGGCTAGAVHDAVELERRGLPTITLCHLEFEQQARRYAKALGLAELPLYVYPAPAGGNMAWNASELANEGIEQIIAAFVESPKVRP